MKLVLLFIVAFAGCRKISDTVDNNIVHAPLTSEVSTLDPANSYDVVSATVIYQAYETLYEYHYFKRPYTLQPLLAESMPKVSDDGMTYTIKLKKGIRFHDNPSFGGKPRYLKSVDFLNQIKRLAYIPTKSTGWWLFDGKIKGINEFRKTVGNDFSKFFSTPISGIKTPDEHTIVFDLTRPYPQMVYALAMSFTAPMPKELIEKYQNDMSQIMVGTGPFQLKKWNKLLEIVLERNPHYRKANYPSQGDRFANDRGYLKDAGKQIPFVDGIHFHVIKEANTRWLNFLKNKIDFLVIDKDNFASAVTPSGELSGELKEKQIKLQVASTLTYWWLSFNMKDKIVGKNKDLRLAIAHAIDVDKYIKLFTNNVAQKANSIYPPGIPGYNPSHELYYKYDIATAKEYLKKAGYPDGKGLPVINYDVRGNSSTSRQMAEFIKSELEKVGVRININVNTFPGFLKKARTGQLQFWRGGWALDYPDSENILQLLITKNHSPGPNSSFYSNDKIDEMFKKLAILPNGPQKYQLMKEMEEIVEKDLPWAMFYYTRNYILHNNRVFNYRQSDIIYNGFKYIKLGEY